MALQGLIILVAGGAKSQCNLSWLTCQELLLMSRFPVEV